MNNANVISQVLISALDLYLDYRARGYEIEEQTREELEKRLQQLTSDLRDIPDLPEE